MKKFFLSVLIIGMAVFHANDAKAAEPYVNAGICTIPQNGPSTCNINVDWFAPVTGGAELPYNQEPTERALNTIELPPCLYRNGVQIACGYSGSQSFAVPQGINFFTLKRVTEPTLAGASVTIHFENYTPPFSWTATTHNEIVGDFDGDGDNDIFVQPKLKNVQTGLFPQALNDYYNHSIHKHWTGKHTQISQIEDWSGDSYGAYSANLSNAPGDELLLLGKRKIVLLHGDVITPIVLFPSVKNAIVSWDANSVASYTNFEFDGNFDDYIVHLGDFDGDGFHELFLQSLTFGSESYLLESNGTIAQIFGIGYHNTDWSLESYDFVIRDVNGDGVDDFVMYSNSALYQDNVAFVNDNRINSTETQIEFVATNQNDLHNSFGPEVGNVIEDTINVGVIPASSVVSPDGSFNYSVPILTSPGVKGLAPEISVSYSSSSVNGVMGPGWNINGISNIHRCTDPDAQKAINRTIQFSSSDRYCLDGINMRNTGTNFYVADNSYSMIESIGGTVDNPDYFVATHTDGSRTYYGQNTGKISAANAGKTYAWAIFRQVDVNGNYIEYEYEQTPNSLEFYPIEIRYNGNLNNTIPVSKIRFAYSSGTLRAKTGYLAGENTGITKRLDKIYSESEGLKIRDYIFHYDEDNKVLTSIEVCNQNQCLPKTSFDWITDEDKDTRYFGGMVGAAPVSRRDNMGFQLADITGDGAPEIIGIKNNTYNNNKDHIVVLQHNKELNEFIFLQEIREQANSEFRQTWRLVDLDNDGDKDLIFGRHSFSGQVGLGSWAYMLSDGSKFDEANIKWLRQGQGSADSDWGEAYQLPDFALASNHSDTFVTDLNGDGAEDFVYIKDNTLHYRTLERRVVGNNITQFRLGLEQHAAIKFNKHLANAADEHLATYEFSISTEQIGSISSVAEFNGDGHADLWLKVVETRRVAGTVQQEVSWRAVISDDWSVHGNVGPGSYIFKEYDSIPYNGFLSNFYFVDINGDGLTDLFKDSTETYRLNTGVGFTTDIPANIPNSDSFFRFADFDNDGDLDIFHHMTTDAGSKQAVTFYNGNGFGSTTAIGSCCWADEGHLVLADFNNDGFSDYLTYQGHQNHALRSKKSLNRIYKVTDGYGKETNISYLPLTDSRVYENTTNAPIQSSHFGNGKYVYDIIMPQYVVHTYHEGLEHIRYKYFDWKAQIGIGSLGFKSINMEHANTGIMTSTVYHQSYPKVGLVQSVSRYKVNYQGEFVDDFACNGRNFEVGCDHSFDNLIELSKKKLSSESYSYKENTQIHGSQHYKELILSSNYNFDDETLLARTRTKIRSVDRFGNVLEREQVVIDHSSPELVEHRTEIFTPYNTFGSYYGARKTSEKNISSRSNSSQIIERNKSFYYDSNGEILRIVVEEGVDDYELTTEIIERDVFGNVIESKITGRDVDEQVVRSSYDSSGRYIEFTYNALAQSTQNIYSTKAKAMGFIDSVIDNVGIETSWTYSALGRKKAETRADGSYSYIYQNWCNGIHNEVIYDSSDCPVDAVYVETTEETGTPTKKEYFDKYGRSIRKSSLSFSGKWVNADTIYDELGRVEKSSQPYFNGQTVFYTSYEYDELSRVKKTTMHDGGVWLKTYNKFSESTRNPNGLEHFEIKNAIGQLINVQDIHEEENKYLSTQYEYDVVGNLVTLDGPLAGEIDAVILVYDNKGYFKQSMDDPSKGLWKYRYDQLGQILWQQNSEGQETISEYDKLGRTVRQTRYFGAANQSTIEHDTVSVYDTAPLMQSTGLAVGRLHYTIDHVSGVKREYRYDQLGRNIEKIDTIDNRIFTQTTLYDSIGRVTNTQDATGKKVRNFYNENGYMYAFSDDSTGEVLWQAKNSDQFGNVTYAFLSNARMLQTATYNNRTGLIERIQSGKVAGSSQEFQDEDYTWDLVGNLVVRKDFNLDSREEVFGYDGLNRLVSSQKMGLAEQRVSFDDSGNITYKSDLGYYCYDGNSPHAVTKVRSTSCTGGDAVEYQYDSKGNMTQGRNRTISYTSYDKPKVISTGNYTVEFFYGPDLRRYKRQETKGGVTTTTLYVGNVEFISKSNEAGEAQQRHINGIYTELRDASGVQQFNYLFKDHLGSIVFVATRAGGTVAQFSFDAWGKRRPVDWSPGGTSFSQIASLSSQLTMFKRGYTGHEQVDDAGLIHMNGRIYDPVLARFLSADPYIQAATNQQSLNRYSYVLNNPLNKTDPSGYFWVNIAYSLVASAMSHYAMTSALMVLSHAMTIYSYYSTYQAAVGVMQTYHAWQNGAGGGVWGKLAKGFFVSQMMGSISGAISNYICSASCWRAGSVSTDKPQQRSGSDSAQLTIEEDMFDKNGDLIPSGDCKIGLENCMLGEHFPHLKVKSDRLTGVINMGCGKDSFNACKTIVGHWRKMIENNSDSLDIQVNVVDDKSENIHGYIRINESQTKRFHAWFDAIRTNVLWVSPSANINDSKLWQHEFGHVLGLKHLNNNTKNFMSYYGGISKKTDINFKIHPVQKEHMIDLYDHWYDF